MKKILSLLMGMAFVLTFGLVYAEDSMTETNDTSDTSDKMIRDDDLSHIILDQDRATVNQMQAAPEAKGSGAGGVSGDSDSPMDQGKAPVDKGAAEPGAEGSSAGGVSKDSDTKIDQGEKAPVDKTPAGPGTEGSGTSGESKDADSYR